MKFLSILLTALLLVVVPLAYGQAYRYDEAGRLQEVRYPSGSGVTYTYDIRDNITSVTPFTVPPAVTRFNITSVPARRAELSWEHTGDGTEFLIQRRVGPSGEWEDFATADINARTAIVSNPAGQEDWYLRIVVNGAGAGIQSSPSAALQFPSGTALLVTTSADENDSSLGQGAGDSLREVVAASGSGDVINFAPILSGQTIVLGGTPLRIDKSVVIDGSQLADKITIRGSGATRVVNVADAVSVTLHGLIITDGNSSLGGGISNDGVALELRRCILTGNRSSDKGGAVYNFNGGSLSVTDSTVFTSNTATVSGGAIHNETGSSLDVNRGAFTDNSASEGGAIYNMGAQLSVGNASFSNNGADSGGAILNKDSTGVVVNCTLAFNGANTDTGGGVANQGNANLTLRHCTVASNFGVGVFNASPAAITLENTIVSGNFTVANVAEDVLGDFTAVGANLIRNVTGTRLTGPAPLNSDPVLGSLSSGALPPQVGSPVIDAAVVTADTPSTDQQRSQRIFAEGPDLGAIESKLNADVDLLWLTTSAGHLTPRFDSTILSYSASVPDAVTTAAVRPAKSSNRQTVEVRINGGAFSTVGSKQASPDLPLNPGINTIEVKVTAQNGTTNQTYEIMVTRGEQSSATLGLASLSISGGALSPAFNPEIPAYYMLVPNGTSTTTVTAPPASASSVVMVRANFGEFIAVASGSASPPLALNIGDNTIEIKVTDASGATTELYTLTVTRDSPATSNADLASLVASPGALTPSFFPSVAHYQVTSASGTTTATVTPTSANPAATIQVRANGAAFRAVASGAASQLITLNPGANFVEVKVTAADGTLRTYSLVITRAVSNLEWASEPGNNPSTDSVISADCRFVAFASRASNLVPDDTNSTDDIFVYDRTTQAIERVSVSSAGDEGDFASFSPSISADGNYVAFASEATNLVPDDNNGRTSKSAGRDVFVYDRSTKTIERVSLRENGGEANQKSESPSISADGRYVAFQSGANNLIAGYRNGEVNVYVRDRIANTIIGISVPYSVSPSNRVSLNPAISADGAFVAFEFRASRNDGNRSFQYRDVYLFNRSNGAVERITGTKVGLAADGTESESPSISADGRYVAFQSELEDLDFFDVNRRMDVFVFDRVEGTTRRVSTSFDGVEQLFQDSINPSISGNGRHVAFQSRIANFVSSDTNEKIDVFVKDLVTGEMSLKSSSPAGIQGDGDSTAPSLSFDGQCIAFESRATNLGTADTNSSGDIFVASAEPLVASSDTALAFLTSNLGTINPGLNPGVTSLNTTVSEELRIARVKPVPVDSDAIVEVNLNGSAFAELSPDEVAALSLQPGANSIQIKVTAEDGQTSQTYTLAVKRTAPDTNATNASLASLVPSTGSLSPSFSSSTPLYTMTVPNTTASLTFVPTVAQSGATVIINGTAVASGTASGAIPLSVGETNVVVEITAPDGITTTIYAVEITRSLGNNADLTSVVLSSGSLTPTFSRAVTQYDASVPNGVSAITLTPTAAIPEATITVNGIPVASGTSSGPVDLDPGSNIIFITVVTGTTKTYTVTVNRAPGTGGEFEITDVEYIDSVPGTVRITWQSEPGTTYVLEQSEDLIFWEAFGGDQIGDDLTTTVELEIQGATRTELYLRARRK